MMDRDTIVCDRKIMPESDDGDQQHGSASTQSSWRTTRIASGCAVLAFCGLLSIRMRKLLQFRRLAEQQVYKNVDPQKPWIKKRETQQRGHCVTSIGRLSSRIRGSIASCSSRLSKGSLGQTFLVLQESVENRVKDAPGTNKGIKLAACRQKMNPFASRFA